ncbi:MAG: hydroxymethylbilane synthase [Solirubrobacteraceae bacterium]|nr:hydroxymethylbilane synthase [Solirubrobacteraceae bacterium]
MKLGTRGSALALAQAGTVAAAIEGCELETITTSGDRGFDPSDDKERWVRELDAALVDGRVALAVHSAKDLPAKLEQGIVIAATPVRANPFDVLCGAESLTDLPQGARVGTSSVRRSAQLLALRDDLQISELHGNVDTRLAALEGDEYEAIVIAMAGLERLGRADQAGSLLDQMIPAAGQGTLAITARAGDAESIALAFALDDAATHRCLAAERALIDVLEADCHTPVGAHATTDGEAMTLAAFVGRTDGSAWLRDELTVSGSASTPEELGREVGSRMLASGANEVLGR